LFQWNLLEVYIYICDVFFQVERLPETNSKFTPEPGSKLLVKIHPRKLRAISPNHGGNERSKRLPFWGKRLTFQEYLLLTLGRVLELYHLLQRVFNDPTFLVQVNDVDLSSIFKV